MSSLRLTEDATSDADRDTLAPLPLPTPWGGVSGGSVVGGVAGGGAGAGAGGGGGSGAAPHIPYYPTGYAPMSYTYSSDPLGAGPMPSSTFTYGREGSVHSGSGTVIIICCASFMWFSNLKLLPNISGSSGSDVRSGLMGGDRSQPPSLLGAVNPVGPGIHGSSSSSGSSSTSGNTFRQSSRR